LQIGASTGYSRAPYYGSRWAPNYDIGLLTELNQYLTFGIRLRDISGVTIHHRNGQILQTFDQQLALGTQLTPHPIIRWHSRLDFHPYCFGTSVEIGTQAVAAHAGATFPLGIQAPPSSWSIGASFNQFGKQLHYTYLNQQNFETRHLVSVGMSFGGRHTFLQQLQLPIHKRSPTIIPTSKPKPPLKQIDPAYESVQIAKQYDIELPLLLAIVYVESNFNPIAVSPSGAAGLMQMMPQTARGLGIKVPQYTDKRTPRIDPRLDERFDPRKNLHAGLTYFKKLLKKDRNDVTRALGAYNVGTGRVEIGQPLNSRAQKYADKVLKRCQYYRANPTEKQAALKRLEATLK